MNEAILQQSTHAVASSFERTLQAEEVRDYLLQHPEFFALYPELVTQIAVPHKQKGSVSLVELQSVQLRKKVEQLSFKLAQLIQVAKQNQSIYEIFAALNLRLLSCNNFSQLQAVLAEVLKDQLQMSAVSIIPFQGEQAMSEIQQRALTDKRFKDTEFFFGRLSQNEKQVLFGQAKAESSALVLLGTKRDMAILAVGHADEGHFTPDMDTLLLNQLKAFLDVALPELIGVT